MRTGRLLLGMAVIVAALAGSFVLHEYHAVRRVACADYAKGDDDITFLHPCIASARTRWAEFAAFTVIFLGLTVGGGLLARFWTEPARSGERGHRVPVH